MSKWTKANEYVPVTKGSTAVITLQSDGDVYGYMDASTTGVLLASASAGVTKVPTGSFSKITCTAPFILTTESAMSRLRGGQSGTPGGGAGNDWITVNDAGEAVLNFPEDRDLPIKFAYSGFTRVTGTTGGKTELNRFLQQIPATEVELNIPAGVDISYIFYFNIQQQRVNINAPKAKICNHAFTSNSNLPYVNLNLPSGENCSYIVYSCGALAQAELNLPNASNLKGAIDVCSSLYDLTFNFGAMSTLDFTSISGTGGLGNVTSLENVTVLEGGLASCTSFIITNSTNLTDASIQNIIDALPDYSGTKTSALVSFPPDRLTAEQQEQLTSKGWTWS